MIFYVERDNKVTVCDKVETERDWMSQAIVVLPGREFRRVLDHSRSTCRRGKWKNRRKIEEKKQCLNRGTQTHQFLKIWHDIAKCEKYPIGQATCPKRKISWIPVFLSSVKNGNKQIFIHVCHITNAEHFLCCLLLFHISSFCGFFCFLITIAHCLNHAIWNHCSRHLFPNCTSAQSRKARTLSCRGGQFWEHPTVPGCSPIRNSELASEILRPVVGWP